MPKNGQFLHSTKPKRLFLKKNLFVLDMFMGYLKVAPSVRLFFCAHCELFEQRSSYDIVIFDVFPPQILQEITWFLVGFVC
jgi:hypothetical protein